MTTERPQRERPSALKWVSLALLILATAAVPFFALLWGVSALGAAVGGNDDVDATYGPAGGSFGVLLLGFGVGLIAWIAGCVTQRRRGARQSTTAFRVSTAALAAGMVITALLWIPLGWQALHQDDLRADMRRLEKAMPAEYRLDDSSDEGFDASGLIEPERTWIAPKSARPCDQLEPIFTKWAGQKPDITDRGNGCIFETVRHGWDITISASSGTDSTDPKGRAQIELTSKV